MSVPEKEEKGNATLEPNDQTSLEMAIWKMYLVREAVFDPKRDKYLAVLGPREAQGTPIQCYFDTPLAWPATIHKYQGKTFAPDLIIGPRPTSLPRILGPKRTKAEHTRDLLLISSVIDPLVKDA